MNQDLSFRKTVILSLPRDGVSIRSVGLYGAAWVNPDDEQAVARLLSDLGELRADGYIRFDSFERYPQFGSLRGVPTPWEQMLARGLGLDDPAGTRYFCSDTRFYGPIIEDVQALVGDMSGEQLAQELADVFGYDPTEIPSIVESRRRVLDTLNDGVGQVLKAPRLDPVSFVHNPWVILSTNPSQKGLKDDPLTLGEVFFSSLLAGDCAEQRYFIQTLVDRVHELPDENNYGDEYDFVRTLLFDFWTLYRDDLNEGPLAYGSSVG